MFSRRLIRDVVNYGLAPARRRVVRGVFLVGSVVGLIAILWVYWPIVADTLANGDYVWLILGCPLYLIAMVFAIYGWHRLCVFLGISRGISNDASYYTLSTIAGRLPGGIWGLVARVYFYRSSKVNTRAAATAWVAEQGLVLGAGLFCVLVWFVIRGVGQAQALAWALGACGLGGVGLVAVAVPGVRRVIRTALIARLERYVVPGSAFPSPRQLIAWLAIYSVVWCLGGVLLFVTLRVFSEISIQALPSVELAWIGSRTLSLIITILPSGLGLTEAALALILTSVVPVPVAATAAMLVRLVTTLGELIVAAFFLTYQKFQGAVGPRQAPALHGQVGAENTCD